jgi:hypothetical protein
MSVRLLSLLNAAGNAIQANASLADGQRLETARIVDYQKGLARMNLHVRGINGPEERGHIQLQQFTFSDGRTCIKAFLAWSACDRQAALDIFGSEDTNWDAEAGRVAEAWLDGRPVDEGNASMAAAG